MSKDKKLRITPIELVIFIIIIVIVAIIAVPPIVRHNSQKDTRGEMAMAHNIQANLQRELSDLYSGGLEFIPGADYSDTHVLMAGTEPSEDSTVKAVLKKYNIVLPSGATLTDINVDENTGKLAHFVYSRGASKIIWNGSTLEQQ